jgi:multiple sugar transport system substrate-binding protein
MMFTRLALSRAVLTMGAALGTAQAAAAEGTLTMWARNDLDTLLPPLVEAFNASHDTQVEVQVVPGAELVQKFATAAAGGSAPDMLSLDLIFTPAFAAAGQLTDLTEIAEGLPYLDQLSPAHVRVGTHEGRIYGLPFAADASFILWNKDLFRQAGLDPERGPATWAEIEEMAGAVDALGGDVNGFYLAGACGGCNAFTFLPFVWAQGGDIFADDGATATLDTPEMRAAIDLYRGLIEKGYVPEGAETENGSTWLSTFASGNIGIQPLGAFAIGALNAGYPDIDYGVTPIPSPDGSAASSFGGGDNLVVSAAAENMEGVREFVGFIYSLEGQRILAQYSGVPTRADTAEQALEGLDPRYLVAVEAMRSGRTPASVVYNDLLNSSTGPWATMIGEVLYGDDVDGSLAYAQETMQQIIDDAAM